MPPVNAKTSAAPSATMPAPDRAQAFAAAFARELGQSSQGVDAAKPACGRRPSPVATLLARRWAAHPGATTAARVVGPGAPRALPVDGIPDGPRAGQCAGRAGPATTSCSARWPRGGHDLRRRARARARCRARQRRPRPAGRLLPRFLRRTRRALVRLRPALPLRHVRAADPGRPPGRSRPTTGCATATPGTCRAPEVQLPGRLRRPRGQAEGGARRWLPAERAASPTPSISSCPAHHGERVSTLRQWQAQRRAADRPRSVLSRGDTCAGRAAPRAGRCAELGAVPGRQQPGRARAAPEAGSVPGQRLAAGHASPATCANTATCSNWAGATRSISTTPIRRWRRPS